MDTSDLPLSEVIEEASATQIFTYALLAGWVLLLYDTVLTFGSEKELIWQRKFRPGSILYLMARYGAIIKFGSLTINYIGAPGDGELEFCTVTAYILDISDIFATAGIQGLLLSRAYAVSKRSKWVTVILILLFCCAVGLSAAFIPFAPCDSAMGPQFTLNTLSSVIICVTEASVLAITFFFTWREHRELRRVHGSGTHSIVTLFFRQGVIRFLIIFTWSLEAAIQQKLINPLFSGIDTSLEGAVSTILICRFLLDIRRYTENVQAGISHNNRGYTSVLTSFRAAARQLNTTIIEDFGELDPYRSSADTSFDLDDIPSGCNREDPAVNAVGLA